MLADQDKKQKHDFFKMGSCHFEIFLKYISMVLKKTKQTCFCPPYTDMHENKCEIWPEFYQFCLHFGE